METARCNGKEFVELSTEILGKGNYMRFQANGQSMHPTIRDGDVIKVKPTKLNEIGVGDVIFYRTSSSGTAHRVIKKDLEGDKIVFLTKGDFLHGLDQEVYQEQVLGKVIAIERDGEDIRIDSGMAKLMGILHARVFLFTPWIHNAFCKAGLWLYVMPVWASKKLQGIKLYRDMLRRLFQGRIVYEFATSEDASLLSQLYNYNKHLFPHDPTEIYRKGIKVLEDSGGYCILAKRGGKIIGGVVIRKTPERSSPDGNWWLSSLLVRFRYRGMGIGEELVKRAIEKASSEGAFEINLTTLENSKSAIALYEKLGFRRISIPNSKGKFEEAIKGRSSDSIIMAKPM